MNVSQTTSECGVDRSADLKAASSTGSLPLNVPASLTVAVETDSLKKVKDSPADGIPMSTVTQRHDSTGKDPVLTNESLRPVSVESFNAYETDVRNAPKMRSRKYETRTNSMDGPKRDWELRIDADGNYVYVHPEDASQMLLASSTDAHLNMGRLESPALHTAASSSVPFGGRPSERIPAAAPAPTRTNPAQSGAKSSGSFRLLDLPNYLQSANAIAPSSSLPKIDLSEVINWESVRDLLPNEDVLVRLCERLPPRDPEDKILNASESVLSNLQSPQFKAAAKSFSEAFHSGELALVMSQFGVCEGAVNAARTGDLEALATAMQDASNLHSKAPSDAHIFTGKDKDKEQDPSNPKDDGPEQMDTS